MLPTLLARKKYEEAMSDEHPQVYQNVLQINSLKQCIFQPIIEEFINKTNFYYQISRYHVHIQ